MTKPAEDRLAAIKALVTAPEIMERWDSWRAYIADGGKASWPRDAFESLIDCIVGECDDD